MICPHCNREIPQSAIASHLGRIVTDKRRQASRLNGAKGGRPPDPNSARQRKKLKP